jgi:crotonobetainyl-CoA:carnitine CoA-transferase CaiB-like acyl-CoA transferase
VRRLAQQSDVVIENFKVGGLAQYGLDYASLSALNSRLVYCSITGFGQTGPYAARAGYDFLIQGLGGLMSVTGRRDSEPGGGPLKVGVALTDILTGVYASSAILAALAYRERSGVGQHIDLALLDVQVACLANQALSYLDDRQRAEAARQRAPEHRAVSGLSDARRSDAACDRQRRSVSQLLRRGRRAVARGRSALRDERAPRREPRRADTATAAVDRRANRPRSGPLRWPKRAYRAGRSTISRRCSPTRTSWRAALASRIEHETLGSVPTVASPLRLSATPVTYDAAPPGLGEHTDSVLADALGLSPDEIVSLRSRGIV